MKALFLLPLLALPLAGCDTSFLSSSGLTSVTSAICTDATTLQGSGLTLNSNQTLALNGILSTCASTAGGTSFNNATIALAIIQDAILLQKSGLLSNVKLKALAPEQRQSLLKIQAKWQHYNTYHAF